MINNRKQFSLEFKLDAISLVIEQKRKVAEVAEVAESLGGWHINPRQLGTQVSKRTARHCISYWFSLDR